MTSLSAQLDALLPLVSKPSRYLGNEFHVIVKTPEAGMVQWCLILPEVYEIGMSHWGLRILYEVLNRRSDALAERCFSPWPDMEAQLRGRGLPLYALESKRPLAEFDFLGFSLQYELTYTNILQCLDLAGVPLRSEDRTEGDPLVIAGGPCASNPEPLADFIDLFLIGDGEKMVGEITEAYKALRARPRFEILREMAKLPGIYVPRMYEATYDGDGRLLGTRPRYAGVPERVERQFIADLENAPVPRSPIVPLQEIVQDRLSVEVVRGCTQGCRFCQAGYLYRPIRERSAGKILEIADEGIRATGWKEVGLTSLSTADHTQLEAMAEVLNARFGSDRVGLALPSLRADSFGVEIADRMKETKRTGFTFAPEVGSERLRLAVNKLIRDEEFFEAARIAYERGWRLIKMYFMVGLPTETPADIDGIVHFINTVREIGRAHGPANTVNASIGAFVPKSHTPFQWDAFEPVEELREKIDYVRRSCSSRWSRVKWHDVRTSHLEACFSMGDRRLGPAIEWAYRHGARFDGWTEHFDYDRWMRAFRETGVDPDHHTRKRGFDEALPWDHIDIRVRRKWLIRERAKTDDPVFELGRSLTADCRHGDCTACGIPGLPFDTQLAPRMDPEEKSRLLRRAAEAAPPRRDADVSWSVRIRYRKTGPARFLSHLETATAFARGFRMARIPLAYSRGHSPRPKFHFAPPLPVGLEGEEEAFDVELLEPWVDGMTHRLNGVLPQGLGVLDGRPVQIVPGFRRPSLTQKARRARYRVDLSGLPREDRERIARILEAFPAMESCVVERGHWTPASSRSATDWESPMDPLAAPEATGRPESPDGDTGIRSAANGAPVPGVVRGGHPAPAPPASRRAADGDAARDDGREETRPDPAPAAPRRRGGAKTPPRRTVDLKRAIRQARLAESSGRLDLDLYLAREDGQVANPKSVLERLFHLTPEAQAGIRIVRTALLTEAGETIFENEGAAGDRRVAPAPKPVAL